MKALALLVVALFTLSVGGCSRKAKEVNIEAERAAILEVDQELLQAAQAKDVNRFLSFYTDDVWLLPPDAPVLTEKQAIHELWSKLLAQSTLKWQVLKTEVSRDGDLAYTIGVYEVTTTDPQARIVRGKYVGLWKKQADGSWKQPVDIWNSSEPSGATSREVKH